MGREVEVGRPTASSNPDRQETISESTGMRGPFHTVRARVELTAIDVRTNEILAVNRGTASAADLAEQVAAKTALEKATLKVCPEFISELQSEWTP